MAEQPQQPAPPRPAPQIHILGVRDAPPLPTPERPSPPPPYGAQPGPPPPASLRSDPPQAEPYQATISPDAPSLEQRAADGTLQLAVAKLRCPFCHDAVPRAERCVCADCLAVHHLACWDEHPRCAACNSAHVLKPTGEEPPPPPRRPLAERRPTDFPLPDPCHPAAAATYLGVTLHELNQLISSGQLRARTIDNEIVFTADAVRALRPQVQELIQDRPPRAKRSLVTAAQILEVLALIAALIGVGISFLGPYSFVFGVPLMLPFIVIYLSRANY